MLSSWNRTRKSPVFRCVRGTTTPKRFNYSNIDHLRYIGVVFERPDSYNYDTIKHKYTNVYNIIIQEALAIKSYYFLNKSITWASFMYLFIN